MEMELRVLKYFLAVARHQNITRAAEELHLTQPTLSRQLQDLSFKHIFPMRFRVLTKAVKAVRGNRRHHRCNGEGCHPRRNREEG